MSSISRLRSTCLISLLFLALAGCANKTVHAEETPAVANTPTTLPEKLTAPMSPTDAAMQRAVDEAYTKFKDETEGKNADYIPYLAKVDSKLFGIAIVTVDGKVFTAGDSQSAFPLESVAKVFTAALVMNEMGVDAIREKIGVEPTGMPFNSITAIEMIGTRPSNPLVNAGAIATTSLVEAKSTDERWNKILDNMSRFSGKKLPLNQEVYESEAASNSRNKSIAFLLQNHDRLYSDPLEAVDVYTKLCSVNATSEELAMMGATLANGGKNPKTGEQVMKADDVPELLALMTMAGFYDESGWWAYTVGLPAKTGVGGGIVAVVPGQCAIAAFSPPVNKAGNSVRAQKAIAYIANELKMNVFEEK